MEKCYDDYIESIMNEIRAELKLNKKDIIFDNKYIITIFKDSLVIKNNEYKKTPACLLYGILKHFLMEDDYIKAIDKLNRPDRTKSLLKATIKFIKNKYDFTDRYFI